MSDELNDHKRTERQFGPWLSVVDEASAQRAMKVSFVCIPLLIVAAVAAWFPELNARLGLTIAIIAGLFPVALASAGSLLGAHTVENSRIVMLSILPVGASIAAFVAKVASVADLKQSLLNDGFFYCALILVFFLTLLWIGGIRGMLYMRGRA